jgi:hypothetical protein
MRKVHTILIALTFAILLASCDKPKSFPCNITVEKSADAFTDSFTVYCFEQDYSKSRLVYSGKLLKSKTLITENCNEMVARVGFFKLGNDSVAHYFVIEPGEIGLKINKENVLIKGLQSNRRLIELRNEVKKINDAKKQVLKEYLRMVEDSALTADFERACFVKDSILSDSLQSVIIRGSAINDAVKQIVKEEYSKALKPETWSSLK